VVALDVAIVRGRILHDERSSHHRVAETDAGLSNLVVTGSQACSTGLRGGTVREICSCMSNPSSRGGDPAPPARRQAVAV